MTQREATSEPSSPPSEGVRTIVSLLLVIHLFCVGAVLSSNFAPSGLQRRLVAVLGPYTKTFHLDPNFVPYHLTTGDGDARLHQFILSDADATLARFPDRELRGGFPRQRLDMLARVAAYYAETDVDEVPAELARGLAQYVFTRNGASSSGADRLQVRCVRYVGDGDPAERTGDDARGVDVVYEADVWRDAQGRLNVLKRSPTAEAAPPVSPSTPNKD